MDVSMVGRVEGLKQLDAKRKGTMRVELIGHFKPCMTGIYLHIIFSHYGLYANAPALMQSRARRTAGRPGIMRPSAGLRRPRGVRLRWRRRRTAAA